MMVKFIIGMNLHFPGLAKKHNFFIKMSSNLLSNKTLSNSVIPFSNKIELIDIVTTSSSIIVPGWYYSLTGILVSGGGGGGIGYTSYNTVGGAGGGAGACAVLNLPARPGDTLTITLGAGGAGSGYGAFSTDGGASQININGNFFYLITGGGAGGFQTTVPTYGTNGSQGGFGGNTDGPFTPLPGGGGNPRFTAGYGTYGYSLLAPVTSVLVSGSSYASHVSSVSTVQVADKSLGSKGGAWNIISLPVPTGTSTYGFAGGGGGIGTNSNGLTGGIPIGAGDLTGAHGAPGGAGGLIKYPNNKGVMIAYCIAGGGGGGAYMTYIEPDPPPDPPTPPYEFDFIATGGSGGSIVNDGTTYYSGGSGESYIYTASLSGSNPISSLSAGAGVINTGGGGGGGTDLGANGGSGVFILLGRRSYPFASKVI